jgi:hypothetical protein
MAVYLRGPILGFVLRLRGVVCLHASAVAVKGSAIVIVGSVGRGKSTTAAGFVKLGFPLLSDDVAALRTEGDQISILPGYPRLNLWPNAAKALHGSPDTLPRLTPAGGINDDWDKRYLDLDVDRQFRANPLPLGAVYVLGERIAGQTAPRLEPMSSRDAFLALTEDSYVNYALDQSMRAKEFRTLGELVRMIPVRLVAPQDHVAHVLDLCQAILNDCKGTGSGGVSANHGPHGPKGATRQTSRAAVPS